MRRSVTAVTAVPSHRARYALLAAAAIVVITLVAIVGRTSGSGTTAARPAAKPEIKPTRQNAAAAALTFTQELAVTGVRHPAVYGQRLQDIAAPGADDNVRAAFGAGATQVRALVKGRTGVLRAAPLGYRIDSFDPERATVSVWMIALAGGPLLEPVAQWRLLTIDLRWASDEWRVAGGHGGSGPSPRSPLTELAAQTATFAEVRHVP